MLLVPAIDLRAGRCVRLLQGSFSDTTDYSSDPVETARGFEGHGARWVHVVDLDAAEGKGADNLDVIERIRRALSCRLQVGGGVRRGNHGRPCAGRSATVDGGPRPEVCRGPRRP